ncbi:DUF4861 family protein [Carboxylicivirga sp. A043]|uniref:DUF4861 domain-containing protein n=1 Tax=Carboxylicivirga litoralis TaxID=2816963 RepID=UPI0021CB63BA|nr:DUF4861 domain-containing protein [Carboxylicivirga sp. A043]MCU4157159.1 DUF4861 family protein [Carboxylicivirga sp. A043]
MRLKLQYATMAMLLLLVSSCIERQNDTTVTVSNPTDLERLLETVRVDIPDHLSGITSLVVMDKETKKELLTQIVDENGDNIPESILFQVALQAGETRQYILKAGEATVSAGEVRTFGRFVPERTDDFTWENDKVAFRVYGPTAQRMVEEGIPGGTFSGGVDCWLKKVDYSIIDKWYAGNTAEPGYYHNDHGEGLDNYHVGPSLGCGGTGVMYNAELYTSKNFTAYEVLTNGPIETKFKLESAAFGPKEKEVNQLKVGSIELGSNFTKYVIHIDGSDNLTTGVTLHDKTGEINVDEKACWGDYWAPHEGKELGNAIVVDPKYYARYSEVISEEKDKSHLLMHLKAINGKVEYYAGFTWSDSQQFAGKEAWHQYLNQFAQQIQSPLVVTIQ